MVTAIVLGMTNAASQTDSELWTSVMGSDVTPENLKQVAKSQYVTPHALISVCLDDAIRFRGLQLDKHKTMDALVKLAGLL